MWKHEILRDNALTFKSPLADKNLMASCQQMLRDSVSFYFGEYYDALNIEKGLIGKTVEMPPPPFPCTLIEYSMDKVGKLLPNRNSKEQTVTSSRRALLYGELPGQFRVVASFCYFDKGSKWVLYPLYAIDYANGMHDGFSNVGCFYTDEDLRKSLTMEASFKDLRDDLCNLHVLLTMLNTRNVVTKLVVPPERLNRARIKRKQEPLDKYYILEVVKGIPKTKYQGEVPWDYRPSAERALHMCRGHFKTYTEEAPLFGRHTGTFWWQPSIRGNAENGTIMKDYTVKQAGQEEQDADGK